MDSLRYLPLAEFERLRSAVNAEHARRERARTKDYPRPDPELVAMVVSGVLNPVSAIKTYRAFLQAEGFSPSLAQCKRILDEARASLKTRPATFGPGASQ